MFSYEIARRAAAPEWPRGTRAVSAIGPPSPWFSDSGAG